MNSRSHNSAFSHFLFLSETAPLTSGGSLQLADGQIALTKLKGATANGAQVVADLSGASDNEKFQIQVGTGRTQSAGNMTRGNMKTIPFTKNDIKEVRLSTAKDFVLAETTLGYNGVAGTGITLKEKQATTVSLTLSGPAISYLGFERGRADMQFSIFAGNPDECTNCAEPCASTSCKDIVTKLVNDIRNHQLRPGKGVLGNTGGAVTVGDLVDVIGNYSCAPTKTPTATATYYTLSLQDEGTQEALGVVAAQYPSETVTRIDREGVTSTYQIVTTGSAPAAFDPVTPNELLFDCDCPSGYTQGGGGWWYTVQSEDDGTDNSATLLDAIIGVSDQTGAVYTFTSADSAAGLTPGTYTGVTGTASAAGTGATFTVVVEAGGTVESVTLTGEGAGYVVGETITIAGTAITGGTSPADDIVVTVASLATEATSVTRTFGSAGLGNYLINFASELTATQKQAIIDSNLSVTLESNGEAVSICIPDYQPSDVSWVSGDTCTVSTQAYYIDLKDTECGESRLAELQASYPNITITEDSSVDHENCRRRYTTTVTSNIVCEGCETPEYVFEAPAPYMHFSWKPVEIEDGGLTSFTASAASVTNMTTSPQTITLVNGSGVTYAGSGTGAQIAVSSSTATAVDKITWTAAGSGYEVGETFTIDLATALGGAETGTLTITVTGVSGVFPDDCECGITFKSKEANLCPPAMLEDVGTFTPEGLKIQVSAGESPTVLMEGYSFVTMPFEVSYDVRPFSGTGWGAEFKDIEKESAERFLGISSIRSYSEGYLKGFETKLEKCAQYDVITLKLGRNNYAGTASRTKSEDIRYLFVFDSGRSNVYADLFNALGGNIPS